jgi:hypothetical protein
MPLVKLIQQYPFKPGIKDLFKKVVLDTIMGSSQDNKTKLQQIRIEIEKTQKRLTSLQDKYIDDEIGKEEYHQLKSKYNTDIERLTSQKAEINIMTNVHSSQLEFYMVFWKIFPDSIKRQM